MKIKNKKKRNTNLWPPIIPKAKIRSSRYLSTPPAPPRLRSHRFDDGMFLKTDVLSLRGIIDGLSVGLGCKGNITSLEKSKIKLIKNKKIKKK